MWQKKAETGKKWVVRPRQLDMLQHVRCYQRNKAHVRRSMSACRGVSTPWARVFRARSVRVEKTVCTRLRRMLLILIPRAIWHAHAGCFACFIVKILGLEPDAVRRMALRRWLRQAWRKS